jgi:DNA-binding Lrp family transcriptional regulator
MWRESNWKPNCLNKNPKNQCSIKYIGTLLIKQIKTTNLNRLRTRDVRILEGLALHDPRKKSELAAELNMPVETLRYRLKYLHSHFSLLLLGSVYHTNIGLKKVIVYAESRAGYEELLYQCLKSNDYWLYVSQCIGTPKCLAVYGIPTGKEKQFEEFLSELEKLDQINKVNFLWCTCFQNINVTSIWFDSASEQWIFPWDSWLQEVQTNQGELPYTLQEPKEYIQKADWMDIMILKELEKNCTTKLKEMAKIFKTTLQNIRYHFKNHVIAEKMFEGQQIVVDHYRGLSPETYFFKFSFPNYENFAKFAHSLLNKPFIRVMGKVYGKNQLFVQIYLPRQQLRNLTEALSKLVRIGFLDTYEYVIQDLTKTERQTISYEYFKENNWKYNQKKYLKKLQFTVRNFMES